MIAREVLDILESLEAQDLQETKDLKNSIMKALLALSVLSGSEMSGGSKVKAQKLLKDTIAKVEMIGK